MKAFLVYLTGILSIWQLFLFQQPALSEDTPLRGPPQVDTPILLDSYLPASMQVIAHVTDLMKYDLKPSIGQPTTTTTTTPRPTSPHRPGLFAPDKPLGPASYHRGTSYEEYVQILQNSDGQNYFDKYKNPLEEIDEDVGLRGEARALDIGDGLEGLVGKETAEVLVLANRLEEDDGDANDLERARGFVEQYEDDLKIRDYLRQKKIPPTRAYVGLLSLYDLLNKESKRLGLNKYQVMTLKLVIRFFILFFIGLLWEGTSESVRNIDWFFVWSIKIRAFQGDRETKHKAG